MDLTIKKFREKKVEEITMLKEQLRNDPNNTGILKRLRDIEDEFYGVIAALEEDTKGNIARHLKPYTELKYSAEFKICKVLSLKKENLK